MKLKIKPSAKIKRRYVLINGTKDDIEKAILDYIGILGWAQSSLVFVNSNKSESIISVEVKFLANVRAAIELSGLALKIRKVSGTLKGLGK